MPDMRPRPYLALITLALLIGAGLRASGMGHMLDMAHYDEAYYAVDALSLLDKPRLTPFFPENFGRESLWMYVLAPPLAVFGAGAFALRLAAFFTGMLTLASVGLLARVLLGRRVAVWSAAALGVLFWHVLMSHLAFRALLYPMIGALAFAAWWLAWYSNRPRLWIVTGVLFALLGYTYFAARGWIALALLMSAVGFLFSRERRRGLIEAWLTAVAFAAPLLVFLLANPAASQRLDQVVVSDSWTLVSNLGAWLTAWTGHGADDPMYNLPGRPILDAPLTMLAVIGIAAFALVKRRIHPLSISTQGRGVRLSHRLVLIFLAALIAVSLAPAILTTEPLKWLRAVGVIVPLALLLGLGAAAPDRLLSRQPHPPPPSPFGEVEMSATSRRRVRRRFWLLPVALLLWAGINTAQALFVAVCHDHSPHHARTHAP